MKKLSMIALVSLTTLLAIGCESKKTASKEVQISEISKEESTPTPEVTSAHVQEEDETTVPTEDPTEEVVPTETTVPEDVIDAEDQLTFKTLSNMEFYYSSGVGAWRTVLYIEENGNFWGEYSDSELGSTGEGYPNGTCYFCSFQGHFTEPMKINEYTYAIKINSIDYANEPGTEKVMDETLYVYTEAAGLSLNDTIYIYLPEAPYAELPEEFQNWVWYSRENPEVETLSFYGLYAENEQSGFSGFEVNAMEDLLNNTKQRSDALKSSLENDPLTQIEMNEKSQALYDVWDHALNTVWKKLKAQHSESEFNELLTAQKEWIKEKEQAITEAANEVKGGSLEPLARNMVAATMTEERVYELYALLK